MPTKESTWETRSPRPGFRDNSSVLGKLPVRQRGQYETGIGDRMIQPHVGQVYFFVATVTVCERVSFLAMSNNNCRNGKFW